MGLWMRIVGFSIFLFLLLSISFSRVGAVDEDVVALDLAEAEEALDSAYVAVLDAEEAGANTTGLLVRLSVGGEYLAEAHVWYRLGDLDSASRLTGLCIEAVSGIAGEAVLLRDEALRLGFEDFIVRLVGAVVGVVVVVVGGFVVWRVFSRSYNKRILGLRPGVVSDES